MPIDPYVYPGTQILINRFDLQDAEELQRIESANFILKQNEPLPSGNLDYSHLKAIHQHFFGEIYTWAGQERSVAISKNDSPFCFPDFIHKEINKLFDQLKKEQHLQGLEKPVFCERMAHYFNELNAVHPFREGNGRTLRAFSEKLSQQAGYTLRWGNVERETYLAASIDGFKGITTSMENVFKTISEPIIAPLFHKKTAAVTQNMQKKQETQGLAPSVQEKLLHYIDEQQKQKQLLWDHYEARSGDDRDKAIEAKALVTAHFNELQKLSVALYNDPEIQALMKSLPPNKAIHEGIAWDEVKSTLLNNTDNHQAIHALLAPIRRAGLKDNQALSQQQSQHQGGGRKR